MNYIHPLTLQSQSQIYSILLEEEPWNMIPIDAFEQYGMAHPEHRWFGEFQNGRLLGSIYQHHQLVHFVYNQAPPKNSPLYPFIRKYIPSFITHGKKELLEPIVANLRGQNSQLHEESTFLQQTEKTRKAIQVDLPWPKGLRLRYANQSDLPGLLHMFQHSSVDHQIDVPLISRLVDKRGVLLAEFNKKIIGSIMLLKESPHYWLLGGLYIKPSERYQGLATLLGQYMVKEALLQNKKVCFYYSNPDLKDFYSKAALKSIGTWVSYSISSKPII